MKYLPHVTVAIGLALVIFLIYWINFVYNPQMHRETYIKGWNARYESLVSEGRLESWDYIKYGNEPPE